MFTPLYSRCPKPASKRIGLLTRFDPYMPGLVRIEPVSLA